MSISLNLKSRNESEVRMLFDRRSHNLIFSIADYFQHIDGNFKTCLKHFNSNHCLNCAVRSKAVLEPFVFYCKELLEDEILLKAAEIFTSITCSILPVCFIQVDGTVCLEFQDCNHLPQVEQYLMQKCFGDLTDFVEKHVTEDFFSRLIPMGRYTGEDRMRFAERVNGVLRRICCNISSLTTTAITVISDSNHQALSR